MGHFLFGPELADFDSFSNSVVTVILFTLGIFGRFIIYILIFQGSPGNFFFFFL